jgi:hypothetical protein
MNLNQIIYTAADYKIALSCNGFTVPLTIVESLDYGSKKEHEYIHIVGSEEPVGLKTNTSTYPGKLGMEAGELELFLALNGYVFATQIKDATISIIALTGVLIKVFKSVVVTSHDASIKAKDKRSVISLSWESIGAVGS